MSSFEASIDRDANRQVIAGNDSFKLESTWTFVTGTTGATGAHTLFTVTGNCLVRVFGICDTTATDLDDGDNWVDAGPEVELSSLPSSFIVNDGADIVLTIATAAVSAGVVDFYCIWRPLSSDANITVTTPA
jgi:hypothetical protein